MSSRILITFPQIELLFHYRNEKVWSLCQRNIRPGIRHAGGFPQGKEVF